MTREEKIKVLAELDGWKFFREEVCPAITYEWVSDDELSWECCPAYLTNYDAIIPLIQKQSRATQVRVVLSFNGQNDVSRMVDWLQYTPEQLADALIEAVGKCRE